MKHYIICIFSLLSLALGFTDASAQQPTQDTTTTSSQPPFPQGQQGWTQIQLSTQLPIGLSYPLLQSGFMITDSNLYRSTDSGSVWTALPLPPTRDNFGFYDQQNGYVVSYIGHTAYRTFDGGQTWSGAEDHIQTGVILCTPSLDTAYIAGGSEVTVTYDGGQTWHNQELNIGSIEGMAFHDAKHGIVVGTIQSGPFPHTDRTAGCFTTNDGGVKWVEQYTGVPATGDGVSWISSATIVMISGEPAYVSRSRNAGTTWDSIPLPHHYALRAIDHKAGRILAVGAGGAIITSTDSGATWQQENSGTGVELTQIQVIDSQTAFAGGGQGTLLKTTDGGTDWVQVSPPSIQQLRITAYLEPETPFVHIRYTLPQLQDVTIKVYDLMGKEIETLEDHRLETAGSHTLKFNSAGLTSGVYLYRIDTERYHGSSKFEVAR